MAKILVLGAYGLIGRAIVYQLLDAGHSVVGLGRRPPADNSGIPRLTWRAADISTLSSAEAWHPYIAGVDAIVNCAGVLQSGPRDDVVTVQSVAMRALYQAAEHQKITRFVQISAPGVSMDSPTPFSRTKADADAALSASGLDWVILRPGLVLGSQAYGGSGLLRALAAIPFVQPMVALPGTIQTVGASDVATATLAAVEGRLGACVAFDLVEDERRSFAEVVGQMRAWLGYRPAPVLMLPNWLVRMVFSLGDAAVAFGWRTPICSTALKELRNGVTGDSAPWRATTGQSLSPLPATLGRLPSTIQERRYARLWFLKPATILGLSLFWLLSGAIGLSSLHDATSVLTTRGTDTTLANALVVGGSIIDILLGVFVLVRRTAPLALAGMLAVSAVYLGAGSMLAPDLWSDPLGPYVKIIPGMILTVVALALIEDR
jgi:uncharacterized protein YbjT (DUF2867 family)